MPFHLTSQGSLANLPNFGDLGAGDAFVDQENVGPCDGLVIETGFAVKPGESLQGGGEFFQRFEDGIVAEVGEGHADVVGVVEGVGRKGSAFELGD